MNTQVRAMRDAFLEVLCERMHKNKKIFFLSADFGAPQIDIIKKKFKDRFINVGIAEQNLINIATGLALEGYAVYAYAIASFITMRAFEQIRINLAMLSQLKKINVNLIGVGAGLSYDVSGPTHHCLEDISLMRTLPNLVVFSPSDWVLARSFVDYSLTVKKPKYIRLDSKPLPALYDSKEHFNFSRGFTKMRNGKRLCLVSTGIMTHAALRVADILNKDGIDIGVIDFYMLKDFDAKAFLKEIRKYDFIFSLEEAYVGRAGLDSLINKLILRGRLKTRLYPFGFMDRYVFELGTREYLHKVNHVDQDSIARKVKMILSGKVKI